MQASIATSTTLKGSSANWHQQHFSFHNDDPVDVKTITVVFATFWQREIPLAYSAVQQEVTTGIVPNLPRLHQKVYIDMQSQLSKLQQSGEQTIEECLYVYQSSYPPSLRMYRNTDRPKALCTSPVFSFMDGHTYGS